MSGALAPLSRISRIARDRRDGMPLRSAVCCLIEVQKQPYVASSTTCSGKDGDKHVTRTIVMYFWAPCIFTCIVSLLPSLIASLAVQPQVNLTQALIEAGLTKGPGNGAVGGGLQALK